MMPKRTPRAAGHATGACTSRGVTRRQTLKGAAALLAAAPARAAGPWFHRSRRPVLRVLGTHVTLQDLIRRRAEQELGIRLEFQPGGSAAILQQASTRPESFDVFEQWSNTIPLLWQAGAIKPIASERIDRWGAVNAIPKQGRLDPRMPIGRGDAPHKLLYVQGDGVLGTEESPSVSFLPYVHNVDSFGYSVKDVPEGVPYETESWGWLLDERWRGRVALVNEPTIGLFDAALAAQARGLVQFEDIGAMSREEIDSLMSILIELKRSGHFYGAWSSVPQSVDFMQRGHVVVESMFSPGVSSLRSAGHAVHYAAPKEGYRAWQGVMCLSSQVTPEVEDAAYRYMNWWLSGWAGAVMARQGYYMTVQDPAREHLSEDEWAYWYDGKPAASDLPGPDGQVAVQRGELRRGGAYEERFSHIAVWNTVMSTYEYSLQRWYEFLIA